MTGTDLVHQRPTTVEFRSGCQIARIAYIYPSDGL